MIEDDRDFRDLLGTHLERTLARVDQAEDPFQAINMIYEHDYDAVLLDWNLPQMNGWQTLREAEVAFLLDPVKKKSSHKKIPVLIISADEVRKIKNSPKSIFRQIGFISKVQSLKNINAQILERLKEAFPTLNEDTPPTY